MYYNRNVFDDVTLYRMVIQILTYILLRGTVLSLRVVPVYN